MDPAIIGTIVRSVLLAVSGGLVAKGVISADAAPTLVDQVTTAVSAVVAVGTAIWGVIQKLRAKKVVEQAAATGTVPGKS